MGERLFDYRDLEMYTNNFSDENRIGEGGYGEVYKGMIPKINPYNLPPREIAVKHIKDNNEMKLQQFDNEIRWLRRFNHEGIVEFLGMAEGETFRCIVLKLEARGNLADNIEVLNWTATLSILRQVASAISYVHSIDEGVVLGDVKLQNILLDEDMKPKLCDFGSTRTEGSKLAPSTPGILDMVSWHRGKAMRGDDVQCFGVVILQLLMKSRKALVEIEHETDENGNRKTSRIRFLAEERLKTESHIVHSKLIEPGCSSKDSKDEPGCSSKDEPGCSLKDAETITNLAMELTRMPKVKKVPEVIENTMGDLLRKARRFAEGQETGEAQTESTKSITDEGFAEIEIEAEGEIQPVEELGTSSDEEKKIVRPNMDVVISILNTLQPPIDQHQQPPPFEEESLNMDKKKQQHGMGYYAKVSKKVIGKAIGKVGTKIRNKYVKVVRYVKDGKIMKILKKKVKKVKKKIL